MSSTGTNHSNLRGYRWPMCRCGYSSLKFHQHETERGARIAALAAAVRHEEKNDGQVVYRIGQGGAC